MPDAGTSYSRSMYTECVLVGVLLLASMHTVQYRIQCIKSRTSLRPGREGYREPGYTSHDGWKSTTRTTHIVLPSLEYAMHTTRKASK